MEIAERVVLVTGASRGIGRALVEEALSRGAGRVYAGTRGASEHPRHERVVPVKLDVTDRAQVEAAAAAVPALDILVNNAGIALVDDLSDRAVIERHLEVNLFGSLAVARAFLPQLVRARGAIVNNVSLAALAPMPMSPAYSISKAALLSLTQSLRALTAADGVSVHAVLTGPTDTDMTRDLDLPKASPEAVARALFSGLEAGEDEIFPDPLSRLLADAWLEGPAKELERMNAALPTAT